jgi:hypothetical protein
VLQKRLLNGSFHYAERGASAVRHCSLRAADKESRLSMSVCAPDPGAPRGKMLRAHIAWKGRVALTSSPDGRRPLSHSECSESTLLSRGALYTKNAAAQSAASFVN